MVTRAQNNSQTLDYHWPMYMFVQSIWSARQLNILNILIFPTINYIYILFFFFLLFKVMAEMLTRVTVVLKTFGPRVMMWVQAPSENLSMNDAAIKTHYNTVWKSYKVDVQYCQNTNWRAQTFWAKALGQSCHVCFWWMTFTQNIRPLLYTPTLLFDLYFYTALCSSCARYSTFS